MAFGNFLQQQGLSPDVTAKLQTIYDTPDGAPDPMGAPTAEEMQRYGAKTAEIAAAERFNGGAGPLPSQATTNPTQADPKWTPEAEEKRTATLAADKAAAGVTLHPPEADGDDGSTMMTSSPGHYVAGRWVPTQRGVTEQMGVPMAALLPGQVLHEQAANKRGYAAQELLDASNKEGMAEAVKAAAYTKAAREFAERDQVLQNQKARYAEEEHQKLAMLSQAATQKVDVDAAQGSTGAQIMAAIGIAMGQFGASITGGPNTAMQIVQNNIDRRIKAQEANIANAGKAHDRESSLYRQNLEAFGDRERALAATKIQYLDQVEGMAKQQFASAKSDRNLAQFNEFQASIADARAKELDKFGAETASKITTQGHEAYAPGHMEGGGAVAGDKGKEELFVPELGVYARTKEEAVELRKTSHRTQNTVRELANAKAIIAQADKTSDPRKLAALQRDLKGIAARAAVTATVKEGQGAMSEGDRAVSEAGLGLADIDLGLMSKVNPMAPSLESHSARIDDAIAAHQQEYGRMGSGQQRGREVYVRDPVTGKVEARRVLSGSNAAARNKVDNTSDLIKPPVGESSRKK